MIDVAATRGWLQDFVVGFALHTSRQERGLCPPDLPLRRVYLLHQLFEEPDQGGCALFSTQAGVAFQDCTQFGM